MVQNLEFNYYNEDKLCSHVRVVDGNVTFENFTNNILELAFVSNREVSLKDVYDFFEMRTFPRTRHNARELLDMLGLEEYEPYLICKITEGRMAVEDKQWIQFIE